MKKVALLLLTAALLCSCAARADAIYISQPDAESSDVAAREVILYSYMKAVWVTQFDMASLFGLSEKGYTSAVGVMTDNIASSGLNTVLLQIRPYGDSFYESGYYPRSPLLGDAHYDAVGIFVSECHARGLSVHAWINPLRLMKPDEAGDLTGSLGDMYRAGKLKESGGRLWLDPSYREAIDLVCAGAREALTLYGFDGLHIDDYFYPTRDASFDAAELASSGCDSLASFREGNINTLVSSLYAAVKAVDSRLLFGVSPAGNIDVAKSVCYADVAEWCSSDGYLDYIMPQVYFGFLNGACPFADTVDRWVRTVTSPGIRLYIGVALSKACASAVDVYAVTDEGKNEWIAHKDIIARSVSYIYSSDGCSGLSLFSYGSMFDPLTGKENPALSAEKEAFAPLLRS